MDFTATPLLFLGVHLFGNCTGAGEAVHLSMCMFTWSNYLGLHTKGKREA